MKAYTRPSTAAYQSVAAHGGVAAADPHRLIVLLMDGALDRLARARGSMQHGGSIIEKNDLISSAVGIIDELRASLDLKAGGPIAANLDDLYDYMCRQLVKANLGNRAEMVDEVMHLLAEIRSAWIALPPEARALRPNPA
jgi:flagellar protein FliS